MDEAQIARTESLFRHVNERIAETAARLDGEDAIFVCECADQSCADRVQAPLEEYERTRSDGAQFIVADGHEQTPVERTVGRGRGFRIVRKLGRVGSLARRLDPRTDSA
jgi:hypothetical protein